MQIGITSFLVCICFFRNPAVGQKLSTSKFSTMEWKDEDGNYINAHGAGILHFGNTFYLFGEIKKGTTRLVPDQNWEDYRVPAGGISCYSSNDLLKWKFEGIALASVVDSNSDLDTGRVIERPKVIYNARSGKFVMWMHIDKEDYSYARAGVAISDKPEGPYRYLKSIQPNGQQSRDMTLFNDDDGKAYLIYASENNNTMQICLLSEDYLSPTKKYTRILVNQRREAPAIFKDHDKYFLITSLCSGWAPNAALYSVTKTIMGKWDSVGNPCVGQGAETTFDAQGNFILPVGRNSYIFMTDRWNKTDLPSSGYLWLPFRVKSGKIEIRN
jgi:hypothetical protein